MADGIVDGNSVSRIEGVFMRLLGSQFGQLQPVEEEPDSSQQLYRKEWGTCLYPCVLSHHPLKPYSYTLNNGQQTCTSYRRVSRSLCSSSDGQCATCKESSNDYFLVSISPLDFLIQTIPGCRVDELALYGSSFFRIPFTAQSKVENSPPQTPKFPPSTGARAFIAVRAPILRSP